MKKEITDIPHSIDRLEILMNVLREQCPWDRDQTFSSLRQYTLEEVHEVIEAIDHADWPSLKSELGDLLLQVVFYCCLASEQNLFDLHDVADTVVEKMIRRHPHVFEGSNTDDLSRQWHDLKIREHPDRSSLMDGIPPLPALAYAYKQQKRAARIGFDWSGTGDVIVKMKEELAELSVEVADGSNLSRVEDEFGDVLFTLVNLGRKLGIQAELALMQSNRKFDKRFRCMEDLAVKRNVQLEDLDIDCLEEIYKDAKTITNSDEIREST